MSASYEVTRLLLDWGNGNDAARDELMPLIYSELRQVAEKYLNQERPGHTLQPTALVHEAYIRLVEQTHPEWKSRAHFFAVASQVMRQVLVDHARSKSAAKRGSGCVTLTFDEAIALPQTSQVDVVALDDALSSLSSMDPRQAQIVDLRFFGGLSIEDTAQVLGISPATVNREWSTARMWLQRELRRSDAHDS